jgi:hypothetical protein
MSTTLERFSVGDRVIACDYRIWAKRGHRDLGNNEDCWKPARIVRIHVEPRSQWGPGGRLLYDLKFDHLEEVSTCHLHHAIEEVI